MIKTNTNQTGRSMIEMLGVLAIIGVLTVGGFALISKMSNAHRANEVIDEIGTLANKTRMIFHEFVEDNTDANFHKMSMYVYKARAYPEGLSCLNVDNDGKCKAENSDADSFAFIDKNDVKFEIQHERSGNEIDYFVIKISQLSDDLCMAVAQSTWGSPSINGYVGMCVTDSKKTNCAFNTLTGSSSSGSTPSYIAKGGAKLSLDGAADACANETDNDVYLTFR
ncbi:MAG: hypothetical protein IJ770_03490 [Alphaproteobacteria bacterium]|nr:hypothetical protein [Alphaproteobacteria bacterium]